MAQAGNTLADEAARLEAALERIAGSRPAATPGQAPAHASNIDLTRRLDSLIAELRTVLGRDGAD